LYVRVVGKSDQVIKVWGMVLFDHVIGPISIPRFRMLDAGFLIRGAFSLGPWNPRPLGPFLLNP
jgi:hypothetical protein